MMVRQRGVGPRAYDRREGDVVGALTVDRSHDPPGNVRLGHSDEVLLREAGQDPVDNLRGLPNRVELAGLLDGTERERDGGHGNEVDPGGDEVRMA